MAKCDICLKSLSNYPKHAKTIFEGKDNNGNNYQLDLVYYFYKKDVKYPILCDNCFMDMLQEFINNNRK